MKIHENTVSHTLAHKFTLHAERSLQCVSSMLTPAVMLPLRAPRRGVGCHGAPLQFPGCSIFPCPTWRRESDTSANDPQFAQS